MRFRPLTTKDVLVRARKLIEQPENWTQDKLKRPQWQTDGTLHVAYCALGAIQHVTGSKKLRDKADATLAEAAGVYSVIYWNDRPQRTHEQILAGFTKAIESL